MKNMKKIFALGIVLSMTLVFVGCGGDASYVDGTYTGQWEGYGGPLNLEVTVEDNTIQDVTVVSHNESEGISDDAIEEIPQRIVANNDANVDDVSGATVTSEAIKRATLDALSKANE
ncbi:FMN-binding protein [Natranaerovirga hydrolytica]|uniref:FMN-binding protein n=1 Tax=Natranaerovirga hydrolytica TaxID=680378 RepID=A0A4R1MKB0_9FIRM|nr:FMN-binding protein [Natranaerovirga hydrolytica]TCK93166.1 FMN-binding protein [Natranaerovirga hydrolytica]